MERLVLVDARTRGKKRTVGHERHEALRLMDLIIDLFGDAAGERGLLLLDAVEERARTDRTVNGGNEKRREHNGRHRQRQ